MELWQWIAIGSGAGVAVILAISLAVLAGRRRAERNARTEKLKERFGGEYDRVVAEYGKKAGEDKLENRRETIVNTDTASISPAERASFTERWHEIQHRFIDDPRATVRAADILLVDVMEERGFPTGDIAERSAAVALEAPEQAGAFHAARELFVEIETGQDGERALADYRQALLTYRTLFEEFLDRPASEADARVDAAA